MQNTHFLEFLHYTQVVIDQKGKISTTRSTKTDLEFSAIINFFKQPTPEIWLPSVFFFAVPTSHES